MLVPETKLLLIFLVLISVFTLIVDSRTCNYNGWSHLFYKDSCCGDQVFELGDAIWEHGEECYHQPMDDTLPYKENHWAFYECIVRKALRNQPLNEYTYAAMMSKHLPLEKRQAVLKTLNATATVNQQIPSEYREKLKLYWSRYFNVEFAVCAKLVTQRCKKNKICLKNGRRDYEPQLFCRPSQPARAANYNKYTKQEFNDCLDRINHILHSLAAKANPDYFAPRAQLMCWLISTSNYEPEVEFQKADCNFSELYNSLIPRFASSSSRNLLFQNFQRLVEPKGYRPGQQPRPFRNFMNWFMKGLSLSTLDATSLFLSNLDGALWIKNVVDRTLEQTCQQQWEHK